MTLSTGLIVKGLLGAGAASGVITCIVKKDDIHNWLYRIEEKKKSLGLPESCKWPTGSETSKNCDNLTGENLKGINFDGKGNTDLTVDSTSDKATLTIEKVSDSDFPQGYKFTFKSESTTGIKLKKGQEVFITFGKDMNLEFKIKEEGGKWSLEKAWDVDKLANKVGMESCDTSTKKCTLKANQKINVKEATENKTGTDLKISTESKMTFSDNKVKYNQGFEFTPDSAITLTNETSTTGSTPPSSLETSKKYQIKKESDGKWYLAEVTTS